MELKLICILKVRKKSVLLIVPYGIETMEKPQDTEPKRLLIVPYGIETGSGEGARTAAAAFNRTLWN